MAAAMPENVRRFLEKPNVAVLATRTPGGRLQATPVWFLYTDGQILINTARGRQKLRNLESHPEVALVVLDRENPYRYVQIRGRVAAFDTQNAPTDIDRLSHRYTGGPYQYAAGDRPENRVSIRIAPERVNAMGL
jgi:PPOX class probable F420-dependent enzyme